MAVAGRNILDEQATVSATRSSNKRIAGSGHGDLMTEKQET